MTHIHGKPLMPFKTRSQRAADRAKREEAKAAAREKKAKAKARNPGSRFPKRRDNEYLAWLREGVLAGELRCLIADQHVCEFFPPRRATCERAHVHQTQGAGAGDIGHIVILCPGGHNLEQGRSHEFERTYNVDLMDEAKKLAQRFLNETRRQRDRIYRYMGGE